MVENEVSNCWNGGRQGGNQAQESIAEMNTGRALTRISQQKEREGEDRGGLYAAYVADRKDRQTKRKICTIRQTMNSI